MPGLGAALGDDFQRMADDARRRDLGLVLEELMSEVADCAEGGHVPDVLILVRCNGNMRWTQNGITAERAIFMLQAANMAILDEATTPPWEDGDVDDDDEELAERP